MNSYLANKSEIIVDIFYQRIALLFFYFYFFRNIAKAFDRLHCLFRSTSKQAIVLNGCHSDIQNKNMAPFKHLEMLTFRL